MRDHLPITLERLATMQARLDEGAPLDALLADEALSVEIYDRARRGWLDRMSAEAAQRSFLLAQRYQQAYMSERPDLQAAIDKPPMSLASAAPPTAATGGDIDGTAMALNLDLGAALPFGDASDAPIAEAPIAEAPIVEAPIAEAPDHEPDPLPAWKDPTQATQFVSALPDIHTLPFGKPSPPSAASPAPPAAPPPPAEPSHASEQHASEQRASDQNVDETVMVGELRLDLDGALGGDALPFGGRAAPPPTAADDLPPMPAGDLDGTAFAPSVAQPPASPFAPPPAPVTFTEAQYASFCGERRFAPAALEAIHQRYGIADPQQAQALDAHWEACRRADPALAARLDQHISQYLTWLAQQR